MSEELRDKLRALYEAAGSPVLRLVREERRHETPTSGVQNWSEARVDRPGNSQFAHCADDEDCELIVALVNALPALIDHLEADGGVEAMRERCAVYVENWRDGLKPLLKTDPRDNFLRGEINAANTLAATIRALPVLGVGR